MTWLVNILNCSRRWLYVAACGSFFFALIAVYSNHFHNDFHFDDGHTIQNNLYIRDLRNIPLFFTSTRTFSANPLNQSYRPLVTTTLALDYRLGHGLNPAVFHATSFAFFVIQCVAMLFLFRRLMDRARPHRWNRWLALFAVAWYGLHTANAETVNYIIARSDILSTLGVVLALLMFMSGGRGRRWLLYLIPMAAGVLAKEQGAMAAPLIVLYVALFEHELSVRQLLQPRQLGRVLRDTWPAFVTCAALIAIGSHLADTWVPGGTSRVAYLLTQPFVLLHYAFSFVLPANLSADTDWNPIANPFDDRVTAGLIFIACASWMAAAASRRRETRPVAFGILWFFMALLPTSSLVPLAEVTNDHRMFFPFVGVTLTAAWTLGLMLMRRETHVPAPRWIAPAVVTGCVVVLAAHGYGTRQRNAVWRTEESLWFDVTKKSPENGRGLMNYGLIQMEHGDLDSAEEYFDRALQYTPRYAYLHVNLGVLKSARGDREAAERHFRLAQQYAPDNPVSYFFYGRWLHKAGRYEEAAATVRRALDLSPGHVAARHLLLDITGEQGDWETVEALARETLRIEPDDQLAASWLGEARRRDQPGKRNAEPRDSRATAGSQMTAEQWLGMSLAQFRAGKYEDAKESSREALRLRPEYAEAYNNLCAAENATAQYSSAADACRRALSTQAGPRARP